MASRKTPSDKTAAKIAAASGATSTPVRNSPIPRVPAAAPAAKQITHEQIAARAYFIAQSGTGGDEMHNWLRAERELRGA